MPPPAAASEPTLDFLSPAWIDALDAALSGLHSDGAPTVVEQRVQRTPTEAGGEPGREAVYHLMLGDGPTRAIAGPAAAPDVVFTLDERTAMDIAEGALSPRRAVADDRLVVRGDPGALPTHLEALAGLADATASLRSRTVHPAR